MSGGVSANQPIKQAQVNAFVEQQLDHYGKSIENILSADVMTIRGPIYYGLEESEIGRAHV